ncbi:methylenetetrahydrofolate dehydrogenase (NADP+)/methenyltetrahydrofolate cyclohydrolase [Arcanobacterium wilhelmae]|uniref:Bifunctional protein FolD n=1 Tax=Arcanobacterium wilhelmae TaxID=1803177 RepID=A0ABT9NCL4_9ACTO|nr:tetrahydrofolate dehydrogenase/cyclohydrolase catalytic domain-containing protein [Arcanobacterium wilhelmae]MDP9801462.1 methylenetetrahydrofolate dehydrogenase (NADP+)/methenyltetrahydrofolate cyclohydrolase [Arcanobacterium wilhelmae]WFN90793.1 tetrahydrofolate dehydrogenase/cyclohydrolase catalytic domain-containing protein [Arcanobacterium wilhelmae]
MIVMDGRRVAAELKADLAARVERLGGVGLGTILVGSDPASSLYVNGKHRDSAQVGISSIRVELPETVTTEQIIAEVRRLNADTSCTGFIVQLPLPQHVDTEAVIEAMDPRKDVDGLHPLNLGRLAGQVRGELDIPIPCTPRGIIALGRYYGLDWDGANVCVVGQGETAGRPLGIVASRESVGASVDLCHLKTRNLADHTLAADIVVSATGAGHLVTPEMIRPGAAVFDVGIKRVTDPTTGKSKVMGDVAPGVEDVAGWLSPNPGGVGPMTRAMLLANVVDAKERNA